MSPGRFKPVRADFDKSLLSLGERAVVSAEFGHLWTGLGCTWMESDKLGQVLDGFGWVWGDFGLVWADFGQESEFGVQNDPRDAN